MSTSASPLEVDIDVRYGDFSMQITHAFAGTGTTALFGQSGSGKTTLLRVIAGLERAAAGTMKLGDDIWQDSRADKFCPPHARGIGYVFQEARLFEHLDVAGNLAFAERRAPTTERRIQRREVIAALDLASLMSRAVGQLSGGERQRVAIGRALLTQPRWLLLDEPMSALDMRRRADILPYLQAVPERFGVAALYVSHAVDEVVQLADELVILSDGKVAASGAVADVLSRLDLGPLTGRFEASVVLNAVVRDHDEKFSLTTLQCGEHDAAQLLSVPRAPVAIGQAVKLRVRARDVSIALSRPRGISIRNLLNGTVSDLVEEPDTAYAEVLIDIGAGHVRARLTRLSVQELGLESGMPVVAMVKSVALERPSVAANAVRW